VARSPRARGGPFVDSGNRTDNPLRPYRMAMLGHGFVDEGSEPRFKPDETDPMAYGIVKLRGSRFPTTAVITIVVIAVVVGIIAALVS
jgi:hypothetical protein